MHGRTWECFPKEWVLYGDGLQLRDWLYVRDHTAALRLVLEGGRVGESYHVPDRPGHAAAMRWTPASCGRNWGGNLK